MKFDGMYIEPYCELSLETSDEMEKEMDLVLEGNKHLKLKMENSNTNL